MKNLVIKRLQESKSLEYTRGILRDLLESYLQIELQRQGSNGPSKLDLAIGVACLEVLGNVYAFRTNN